MLVICKNTASPSVLSASNVLSHLLTSAVDPRYTVRTVEGRDTRREKLSWHLQRAHGLLLCCYVKAEFLAYAACKVGA